MDMAVLIGNTNTKIAFITGTSISKISVCRTDDIDSVIKKYKGKEKKQVTVYLASVVPQASRIVKKSFENVKEILWKDFPFEINIRHPEKLGIDRLLNAAGARKLFKNACVIIDAGSAITIDLIDEDGTFKGGVIFPGRALIVKALKNLALLKNIRPSKAKSIIGRDTSEAVSSGITYGISFLVAGYINAIREKNNNLSVIFTGGAGRLLLKHIKKGVYERHLGLIGLQTIIYGSS